MLSKIEVQAKNIQQKFTGNAGKQVRGMQLKDIVVLKKNQKDFLQNQAVVKSNKHNNTSNQYRKLQTSSMFDGKSIMSSNLSRGQTQSSQKDLKNASSIKTGQSRLQKIKARQIQFELIQKYSDEFQLSQSQVFSLMSEYKGLLFLHRSRQDKKKKGRQTVLE